MTAEEDLRQLALLAEVDDLTESLRAWVEGEACWETGRRCRALIRRLLSRMDTLRFRLESPLVVATFGGTGTGKSSLVNALVGQEVTSVGRQRPTTTTPVLLCHPDMPLDSVGIDTEHLDVRPIDAPILRDIVVLDCPDPDTSEAATAGSNLAILRSVLPQCDVLIYTSTQQKYRNARIIDELADAAGGCRIVFVQTHAEMDSDIRDDWKKYLSSQYEVPEMFFVDSVRALQEQLDNYRPSGEFGRLLDMLGRELQASRRVEIRRANLVELLQEALHDCQQKYQSKQPAIDALLQTLEQQRSELKAALSQQLCDDLLVNRSLWESRLLSSVTDKWGFSPFSAVLRFYNGLGAFIASFTFFRARTSAQMALIGAVQGARWIRSRNEEQEAESSLERLSTFGIQDRQLQESRLVISGHLREAGLDTSDQQDRQDLSDLRRRAASVEDEFLGDARRVIDSAIEELAVAHTGWFTKARYEILFLLYVVFLIGRVGYNFFWSSFLGPVISDVPEEDLLAVDFYIPALIFFVIWSALLVTVFTMRLRRGLLRRVRQFADRFAESTLSHGLFPDVESACRTVERDQQTLASLAERTDEFKRRMNDDSSSRLGGRRPQLAGKKENAPDA
ncbi:MAG: hypothetical protein Fues2KO_36320 [Fuerstiella sp.]